MAAIQGSKTVESYPKVWPLSVQAYRVLGESGLIPQDTELLYGQVFKKTSKSPPHSYLVQVLQEILQQATPAGCFVRTEQPLTCSDSEPEPDLAVVPGRKEDYRQEHPGTAELVIEICVTSHQYDRSKTRAYALAGVKELWLVLQPEKQIEVHRRPGGEQFAERILHGPGGQLTCASIPALALDLEKLFG
jgi:Uma2 family endonuclease